MLHGSLYTSQKKAYRAIGFYSTETEREVSLICISSNAAYKSEATFIFAMLYIIVYDHYRVINIIVDQVNIKSYKVELN